MTGTILVLNAGSSSLKFALFAADRLTIQLRGGLSGLGRNACLSVTGPMADRVASAAPPDPACGQAEAVAWLVATLGRLPDLVPLAAGHRVVHGGADFTGPVRVVPGVLEALDALAPLAPAHQPHNLAAIRAVEAAWPGLPQVACFDTAFHRTQPRLAQIFPIPRALSEAGMLRYGFHGLSYQHIAETLPAVAGAQAAGRVVAAHLGHGASLCAMRGGRSIASTMGFTALDGLMMGTRSGAVDPGLVLHLIRQRGLGADRVARMLNEESGLLGVSGISDDVRDLAASADPRAREALDLFVYRAVRETGALIAALGGLDCLVFTAGIGEHAPGIRAGICDGLAFAGVRLDQACNAAGAGRISAASSAVTVHVIPADEERPIARAVAALVAAQDTEWA
jgi:acetate kinase